MLISKRYSATVAKSLNVRIIKTIERQQCNGENDMKTKALINIQGMIFRSEDAAKEYYGDRYETAILEWVEIDEYGEVA